MSRRTEVALFALSGLGMVVGHAAIMRYIHAHPGPVSLSAAAAAFDAGAATASTSPFAAQLADLEARVDILDLKTVLNHTLKRGDSGDDVRRLQQELSDLSLLVSTSITGYYGRDTEQAITDFQIEQQLPSTGRFDPKTRSAFFDTLLAAAESADTANTGSVPAGSTGEPATSLQDQVTGLVSQIDDIQTSITTLQAQVSTLLSSNSVPSGIDSGVSAPATASTPAATTSMASSQGTLAISNIAASNIGSTTATISWSTTVNASGEVDYGLSPTQLTPIKSSVMQTSHAIALQRLLPHTTYNYKVVSVDASGKTQTSSLLTFTTAGH